MTLEEFISLIEAEEEEQQTSTSATTNQETPKNKPEEQDKDTDIPKDNPEGIETPGEEDKVETEEDLAKKKLVDNLQRIVLIKDIIEKVTNYKQDKELMTLLSKVRTFLERIYEKLSDKDFTNIDKINNQTNSILKMIIVFLKQKLA